MPAEGLLGLRPGPFGVALKGDRRRCAASSNPACLCRGFDHYANSIPKSQWNNFFEKMPAEGLFALRAHPFGVALKGDRRRCAASSNPACLCRGLGHYANSIPKSQWSHFFEKITAEGLFALRAHPFGVALKGYRRRRGVVEPACLCR